MGAKRGLNNSSASHDNNTCINPRYPNTQTQRRIRFSIMNYWQKWFD